jgi:putative flippase GtrA
MRRSVNRLMNVPVLRRNIHMLKSAVRYGFTGLAISVAYSLLVVFLVKTVPSWGPTLASVGAFFLILPFSYMAHRGFSFADRARAHWQMSRFVVTNTSSFIVAVGGMYVITNVFGLSYLLGIAWNWLVIPASNFLIYNIWVFPQSTAPDLPRK